MDCRSQCIVFLDRLRKREFFSRPGKSSIARSPPVKQQCIHKLEESQCAQPDAGARRPACKGVFCKRLIWFKTDTEGRIAPTMRSGVLNLREANSGEGMGNIKMSGPGRGELRLA